MARLSILHTRGGILESRHPVVASLVTADGVVRERIGDPMVTTFRSSAKPFQLEGSLGALPPERRASLDDRDLAIGAASHHGEPAHVARVIELLGRFGAREEDLRCGVHWPANERAARDLARAGAPPTPAHNNCSGKHAFMVGASIAAGYVGDYREPDHPLQRAIRAIVDRHADGGVEGVVVDGCGVPSFVLSIDAMARAYASLAAAMADAAESLLGRVGWAMQRHPFLMSGTDAVDGRLVELARRPLVAKVGAEGLICVAYPGERAGLAIKVTSANADARAVAAHALLHRFLPGLVPEKAIERYAIVRNHAGRVVGERRVDLR